MQVVAREIVAEGFEPTQRVVLKSRLVDDAAIEWTASGEFVADARGRIDLSEAPSEGGTFTGVDASGLFWSMQPPSGTDRRFMVEARERAHKGGVPHLDPLRPAHVELRAEIGGVVHASTEVVLRRLAEGIDVRPLRHGRLRGNVFFWRDRGQSRGAIMSLTGSGGGVEMTFAPALASLGYDVVSLAYFAHEDLPPAIANIPLEYFEEGLAWMRRELLASKVAVQGISRGGEATLALASYLPDQIDGACAIVPMYTTSYGWDPSRGSDASHGPSWTWQGRSVPHIQPWSNKTLEELRHLGEASVNGYRSTPEYLEALSMPSARVTALPIERFRGRLLMVSGEDDQLWPSAWGAHLVVNRLRAHGHDRPYNHLCLPNTGHVTPLPNSVTSFTPLAFHSLLNIFIDCGGVPSATARTSWETWRAITEHYRYVFGE